MSDTLKDIFRTVNNDYIDPAKKYYNDLPQEMTDLKYNLFINYSPKTRLFGLLACTVLVGTSLTFAGLKINRSLKFSLFSFYGFGLFIYPELYNSWQDQVGLVSTAEQKL